jgi:hypothetical protein
MSNLMEENLIITTSPKGRTARTLLLRMAADEARAERIRLLKEGHPELKWQAIADHVGVTLRAAQAWANTGSIAYGNAKKLAELFDGIDVDYVMRGPVPSTGATSEESQLDRIEGLLEEVLSRLPELDDRAALERDEEEAERRAVASGALPGPSEESPRQSRSAR